MEKAVDGTSGGAGKGYHRDYPTPSLFGQQSGSAQREYDGAIFGRHPSFADMRWNLCNRFNKICLLRAMKCIVPAGLVRWQSATDRFEFRLTAELQPVKQGLA